MFGMDGHGMFLFDNFVNKVGGPLVHGGVKLELEM